MTGNAHDGTGGEIPLGAYVSRIASAIAYLDGRESLQLNLHLAPLKVPVDTAARVGLLVSELLTNAYQHAFEGRSEGMITVQLYAEDDAIRLTVEDDGVGLSPTTGWPDRGNLGGKIVRSLATGLNARLDVERPGRGTSIQVLIPLDDDAIGNGIPAQDISPAA